MFCWRQGYGRRPWQHLAELEVWRSCLAIADRQCMNNEDIACLKRIDLFSTTKGNCALLSIPTSNRSRCPGATTTRRRTLVCASHDHWSKATNASSMVSSSVKRFARTARSARARRLFLFPNGILVSRVFGKGSSTCGSCCSRQRTRCSWTRWRPKE
jgi:hypothetical protein